VDANPLGRGAAGLPLVGEWDLWESWSYWELWEWSSPGGLCLLGRELSFLVPLPSSHRSHESHASHRSHPLPAISSGDLNDYHHSVPVSFPRGERVDVTATEAYCGLFL